MALPVDRIRRFNRFYTRRIGALQKHFLGTPFSLSEARVLFELAHHEGVTASELGESLDLDAGYLSRMLRDFTQRGLIRRKKSPQDGRVNFLSLTAKGRDAFAPLERRQIDAVNVMLGALSPSEQTRLGGAMETIETLLNEPRAAEPAYTVRTELRPGDPGWIVARHGELYAREYGWDISFEGLVAEIVANFINEFKPGLERAWIAERDGVNAGCVIVVRKSATVAQLRILLVDPSARGLGIGKRLVECCIDFARAAGYRKIVLWTNDVLHAARRIYEAAGFVLAGSERHHSFGHDLVGQTWELKL
ncbi:MAG TPA: helix-turn-helix domain-containing GNAT family N-acetyltransferase [Candidatus Acidoferrales bacterium]|nr:helix-turn-helix domain-containing GNAT family N-acetyltransferase [Candidatus Acidoferrales bacterium]